VQKVHLRCGFNPCFYGNQIRTGNLTTEVYENAYSFNPCFYGNQIRTTIVNRWFARADEFQSLFLWKSN